jgi:uncharacterized protein YukE
MSTPLSLTASEAAAKLAQIESARAQAVAKLQQVQEIQDQMLAASWSGHSATTYGNTSSQQHDEFNTLISDLNSIVDKGSTHIRSVANMDNS